MATHIDKATAMTPSRHVTLFHAPNSRSGGVLVLLEELQADYALKVLNLNKQEQQQAGFLALNPLGKVPTIQHGEAVVTEQVAIYIYLADLYPEAGLAPAIGDPLRGPYLRWIAFYGSCFEPGVVDWSMKREPAAASTSPYGEFDTMFKTLTDQLEKGHYLLGERFSAADVLWGSALNWITMFKLVPDLPVIQSYIARVRARPAVARAATIDAGLAAKQA